MLSTGKLLSKIRLQLHFLHVVSGVMSIRAAAIAAITLGLPSNATSSNLEDLDFSFRDFQNNSLSLDAKITNTSTLKFGKAIETDLTNSSEVVVARLGQIITLQTLKQSNESEQVNQRVSIYDPKSKNSRIIFDADCYKRLHPNETNITIIIDGPLNFSKDGDLCGIRFVANCTSADSKRHQRCGYVIASLVNTYVPFIHTYGFDYVRDYDHPLEVYNDYRSQEKFAFVELSNLAPEVRAEFAKRDTHYVSFQRTGLSDENGNPLAAEFGETLISDQSGVSLEGGPGLSITLKERHSKIERRAWIAPEVESMSAQFTEVKFIPFTFFILRPFEPQKDNCGTLVACSNGSNNLDLQFIEICKNVSSYSICRTAKDQLRIALIINGKCSYLDATIEQNLVSL